MFAHYLAVALRNVRRSPVAFAVNAVTLSLGLVCFVTAYAFVAFWDRADRQFPDIDRIHVLTWRITYSDAPFKQMPQFGTGVPVQAAAYLREDYPGLEKVARALVIDRQTMIASDTQSARLFGLAVDPEFLDLFPLPFTAGNAATALTSPASVVLTRDTARRLFGDANPVGQGVILANAVQAFVTGVIDPVAEPSHLGHTTNATLPFDFVTSMDVRDSVLTATMDPQTLKYLLSSWYPSDGLTYLRLPERGWSAPALAAQLADFGTRHAAADGLRSTSDPFGLKPVRELLEQRDFQRTGLSFGTVLFALASLVLGVACLNYANLATARAAARAREIGVRKALGAKPRQVAAQSLIEAGLLTAAALTVAVLMFSLSGPVIDDLLRVDLAPTLFEGLGVWPFLAAVIGGVTLAAGLYPAIVLARVRPASAIAASDVRIGSKLFSTMLVGTQFAVASALLLAVLIVAIQNAAVRRGGLGLTEDPLLVIENPRRVTKVEPATLRAELARLPQVKSVTEVGTVPWEMTMVSAVRGSLNPTSAARPVIMRGVGEDFFDVFDIRLLAGRMLGGEHAEDLPPPRTPPPADAPRSQASGSGSSGQGPSGQPASSAPPKAGSPGAATSGGGSPDGGASSAAVSPPAPRQTNIVVDLTFAEIFFGSAADAIGKEVYPPENPSNPAQVATGRVIVGVVDNRSFNYMRFGDNRTIGVQYTLQPTLDNTVARIDRNDVAGALERVDALWRQLAPNVALTRRFLDDVFNAEFEYYVRLNRLFGLLSLMAFTISSAGLFGMATLVAVRRRREIGVRKTFGASTAQVVRLLLAGFSKPVVVANIAVWPAVFLGARAYLRQFFEPAPLTLAPFAASLVITLAIAWLAVGGQTWLAARRAPAAVLRRE